MGHVIDFIGKNLHYGADAAALLTGNGYAIPAIEGVNSAGQTLAKGGSIGDALKSGALSGALSYGGSAIGGALGDAVGGTLGGTVGGAALNSLPANAIGSFVGNAIPGELANIGVGSALGGYAGNSLASAINKGNLPQKPAGEPMQSTAQGPSAFVPQQAQAATAPASIAGMSSLTPLQQSTNLATQGTYGGGNGPDEQKYFLNLENRKLVNSDNSTNSLSNLTPIEQSYLAKLGLGGYGDSTSLLKAMNSWSPQ